MVNLIVSSNSTTHEDASFALRALSGVSETFVSTCVETSRAFFRGRWSGMGKAMSGKCQEARVLVVKYAVVVEECGGRECYEGAVAWLGGGKHPRLRHVISSRSGSVLLWALTSPPHAGRFQGRYLSFASHRHRGLSQNWSRHLFLPSPKFQHKSIKKQEPFLGLLPYAEVRRVQQF